MKFFMPVCIVLLIVGNLSCASKKTELEEKSEVEFESDVVVGQEKNDIRIGEGTIAEVVGDNESLAILDNALRATGLDSVLSQGGPYTLFAPSDNAMEKLSELQQDAVADSITREELRNILLHHVVQGNYSDTEIASMDELKSMYGEPLKVIRVNNEITIDSAIFVFSDREAENGYVHIIDEVLIPN